MVNITKDNFSVRQICESGQCFRLQRIEEIDTVQKGEENRRKEENYADGSHSQFSCEKYVLTALGRYLEIEQKQNEIFFDCELEEFELVWKAYFDLEEDYGRIIDLIDSQDSYLLRAAAYGLSHRLAHGLAEGAADWRHHGEP